MVLLFRIYADIVSDPVLLGLVDDCIRMVIKKFYLGGKLPG